MTAESDDFLAARLATAAGELLVTLREERAGYAPYWQVMDEGDAAAHHFLVRELATERPDDAILSEEGLDSRARTFFTVHGKVDMEHTAMAADTVAKFAITDRDQEVVRAAAKNMVRFKIAKFDGIYDFYA